MAWITIATIRIPLNSPSGMDMYRIIGGDSAVGSIIGTRDDEGETEGLTE